MLARELQQPEVKSVIHFSLMHKFNKFQKSPQVYHLKTSIMSGVVAVWSKCIVHIFYHGLSKSTNEQLVNSIKKPFGSNTSKRFSFILSLL